MKIKKIFLNTIILSFLFTFSVINISWSEDTLNKKFNEIVKYSKSGNYEAAYNIVDRLRSNLINAIQIKNIKAPLQILKANICKQLSRNGTEIGFNPNPTPGDLICFLVEVKNYTIMNHDQGGYLSHLSMTGEINNLSGEVILKFGPVTKFINNPVFNYKSLMVKYIKLPKNIKIGEYKIKFHIVDKLKNEKNIDGILKFNIIRKRKDSPIIKVLK